MKHKPLPLDQLIKKVAAAKAAATIDLSTEEDLSIAVMNLVSLEEHFFFTAMKTDKHEYVDMLTTVRELRKELLGKLIDRHEGETWCISKHLLATTMRLMEVGTKLRAEGRAEEAQEMFARAYRLYSLFWALRLKLVTTVQLKESAATDQPWTLQDIVTKLVDCCDE